MILPIFLLLVERGNEFDPDLPPFETLHTHLAVAFFFDFQLITS